MSPLGSKLDLPCDLGVPCSEGHNTLSKAFAGFLLENVDYLCKLIYGRCVRSLHTFLNMPTFEFECKIDKQPVDDNILCHGQTKMAECEPTPSIEKSTAVEVASQLPRRDPN
eukprot:PhF_6_TR19380/c0_g1_i1/m.28384